LNLKKAKNDPTVQKLVVVANVSAIEKIQVTWFDLSFHASFHALVAPKAKARISAKMMKSKNQSSSSLLVDFAS
jgi:hypothetical protein